jgi:hypothetical protein
MLGLGPSLAPASLTSGPLVVPLRLIFAATVISATTRIAGT